MPGTRLIQRIARGFFPAFCGNLDGHVERGLQDVGVTGVGGKSVSTRKAPSLFSRLVARLFGFLQFARTRAVVIKPGSTKIDECVSTADIALDLKAVGFERRHEVLPALAAGDR